MVFDPFIQISMDIIISLKLFLFDHFGIILRRVEMSEKGQEITKLKH